VGLCAAIGCTGLGESPLPTASGADAAPAIDPELETGMRFVDSRAFRREVLEGSLVDPTIGYSVARLENYAIADDDGWDSTPAWNPPVAPMRVVDLGQPAAGDDLSPIEIPDDWDRNALIELGRRAFEDYPLGIRPLDLAVAGEETARGYGAWIDDRERVGGFIRVALGDEVVFAFTCSSCHGRVDAERGALVHGAANPDFDVGRLLSDAAFAAGSSPAPELLGHGPGLADVTTDGTDDPIGFPDLRPLRFQNHINVSGSVRNDLAALAVRIDTLFITNNFYARPPRKLTFAVALYLWSLGERQPTRPLSVQGKRGREVFDAECSACHHHDGTTANPIPAAQVGTDPASALSPARGTGRYRVPSLFMVADRKRLLHRSHLGSLEELLDPARLPSDPGHEFGLALGDADKIALIAYLRESPVFRAPDP